MNISKIKAFFLSKGWVIAVGVILALTYAFTNFLFFNEILHGAMKVFMVCVLATALRSMAFPVSMGKYPFAYLAMDLKERTPEGDNRLRHYWIVTTICYATAILMLFQA